MSQTEQAFNYKENIMLWVLYSAIGLCVGYIILFLFIGSLVPIYFTIPFALLYVATLISHKRIGLNKLIWVTVGITSIHITLATLILFQKEIRLYYIFFCAGPILFVVLNNKQYYLKIALTVGSVALIVFFELIPETTKLLYFSDDTIHILNVVTLVAVGIQIIIPLIVYSHQISANESLYYNKSIIDPLTGLNNRVYLSTYSNDLHNIAKRYKHPYTAMLLDIDHFKRINDTYGHNIGDVALHKVALILRKNIRDSDHAFRYGGEEFLILLPETTISDGYELAERIRQKIEAAQIGEKDLSLTISIGLAEGPASSDFESVIDFADKKLYEAKNKGRNRSEY